MDIIPARFSNRITEKPLPLQRLESCKVVELQFSCCQSKLNFSNHRFDSVSGIGASLLRRWEENGLQVRCPLRRTTKISTFDLLFQPPIRKSIKNSQRNICSQWRSLLPQPLTYSSNFSDVDAVQLSELWGKTLKEPPREPHKIQKAMRHSFAFIIVKDEAALCSDGKPGRIVGVGRAVSDGAFIASICDVAVDPEYQHRGIGRKLVKRLVQEMKGKGPTGFAVFPPPMARRFFWMMGFRADKKYRVMAYTGECLRKKVNEGLEKKQTDSMFSELPILSDEISNGKILRVSVSDPKNGGIENEASIEALQKL